jgi:hypothetical protein
MKGSQESLTTAVVKDAANWLTPQSGDVTGSTREAVVMWANGQRPKTSDQRLRTQVAAEQLKYGHPAPANPSTLGSRQGLLNPRWVETLMGLPVGWTMPSCKSPVTIALTNCASLATESCLQQQSELFDFFGTK